MSWLIYFANTILSGWWFRIFFIFTLTWGKDRIWLIFFKRVETTNKLYIDYMINIKSTCMYVLLSINLCQVNNQECFSLLTSCDIEGEWRGKCPAMISRNTSAHEIYKDYSHKVLKLGEIFWKKRNMRGNQNNTKTLLHMLHGNFTQETKKIKFMGSLGSCYCNSFKVIWLVVGYLCEMLGVVLLYVMFISCF